MYPLSENHVSSPSNCWKASLLCFIKFQHPTNCDKKNNGNCKIHIATIQQLVKVTVQLSMDSLKLQWIIPGDSWAHGNVFCGLKVLGTSLDPCGWNRHEMPSKQTVFLWGHKCNAKNRFNNLSRNNFFFSYHWSKIQKYLCSNCILCNQYYLKQKVVSWHSLLCVIWN